MLNAALKSEPRNADVLALLGRTELAEGKVSEAEADFRQVLEIDPGNRLGMAGMGEVLHAQKQWAASASWIERSRSPEPATLMVLSDDYRKLGRVKDAEFAAALVRSFGGAEKH